VRRSDARWGEVPVAFVVPHDGALTAGDVIDRCRGKIANYKLPKEVRFITQGQLPRNSSGKIERREVEAPAVRAGRSHRHQDREMIRRAPREHSGIAARSRTCGDILRTTERGIFSR
jgi:acyl-CoA synthetase (AMP-forming)/AMP-acid ligase II